MANLQISTPGTVLDMRVGFRSVQTGDTITSVTCTPSHSSLTVSNDAATGGTVSIDGTSFAAGHAVEFDLAATSGMPCGTYQIVFDFTTTNGERLVYRQPVSVEKYL